MAALPFLGHGPPKVPDNLELWLIARDAPPAELSAELSASLPGELRDWALEGENCNGSVGWHERVLYVNSGTGLRYLVKALDPEHLSWLTKDVSAPDIERVLSEVMDEELKGPKAPSASDWDLLGAMIGQWVERVHERYPLWMVVVDRKVNPPGTARHREAVEWVRAHLGEVAAKHGAALESVPPQSSSPAPITSWWWRQAKSAAGWGAPVVSSYLADKAKPPEATRNVLLQLLVGSGMNGMALGSKLVGMWPKSQRPEVVARLLREGHDLGLPLLVAPASHGLLLDDDVHAAAMTPMPRLFPGDMTQQVTKRMTAAKLGPQQSEWLRRILAVAEVDGTLQRLADEEPPDQLGHKTELRWWLALEDLLDS